MPTNVAIDQLGTPRGLKWAAPVALLAVPAYLFAVSLCATLVERGGPTKSWTALNKVTTGPDGAISATRMTL